MSDQTRHDATTADRKKLDFCKGNKNVKKSNMENP